ncbi:hypothetical protein HMN09_01123700 [Mycena chlorophos]|uniref:AB hydrolase-1 domain-containing protein n=1 Tax=Mycena chlorophos TaxID=658473 RepID=A0A8H6SBC7_MYCCL|nr:hypothetical protein HMN09_01123700 [Mycena chlorophos]
MLLLSPAVAVLFAVGNGGLVAALRIQPREETTVAKLPYPLRTVNCATHVPDPIIDEFNLTSTTFPGPLPSTLVCGEIDVAMDHSRPIGPDNTITMGFAMYRPANPSGLILYHAGGPGLDAASSAWDIALNTSNAAAFAGLEALDFLAVNTRGLQFSTPLNCTAGVFYNDLPFAFASTPDEFEAYHEAVSNFIHSCVPNDAPAGYMNHLNTEELVQDYDAIRAALGYEVIDFVSVSYGTFVAQSYANMYPQRVRNFNIDAVLPRGSTFEEMVPSQVAAINRLLLRADALCIVDPSCPFHEQGKGGVVSAWSTILNTSLTAPIPASACGPGTGCNTPVTAVDLQAGASVFLRSNPDFPAFSQAVYEALNGDASKLAYVPAGDIREIVVVPLMCADWKVENKTFAYFQELRTLASADDPANMVYSQIWQFSLMCGAWPYTVPNQTIFETELPLLLITSDFDLNCPSELTTVQFGRSPNSTLIVRHGDDHTSLFLTDLPTHPLQMDFLADGAVPPVQSNVNLTVYPSGTTRAAIPNPYSVPLGILAGDSSAIEVLPESVSVPASDY